MIYILIVAGFLGGSANGYSATTFQEFSSKEKCQVAKERLDRWSSNSDHLLTFCVEK